MSVAAPAQRRRLDVWLVERGTVESREKAQALIMAGRVRVGGAVVTKPGTSVDAEAAVEVALGRDPVGRGALKLEAALDAFGVDPAGRVAVDVGASTGGFTEMLLQRGARRVYAIDVGHGQLHERVQADARVVAREGVNARFLSADHVPEPCTLATVDVSFISVLKILPALKPILDPAADVLALVKPQFEIGRFQVGKGGIVRDPERHRSVLREVTVRAQADAGYVVTNLCASPITGAAGNREFFMHLRLDGIAWSPALIEERVARVVAP